MKSLLLNLLLLTYVLLSFNTSTVHADEIRINDISEGNKLEFGNGEVNRAGYVSVGVDYPAAIGAIINFYQLQQAHINVTEVSPSDKSITISMGKREFLEMSLSSHVTQFVHGMPYVPGIYGFSLKKNDESYNTTHFLSPELVTSLQKDLRKSMVLVSKVKTYASKLSNGQLSASVSCKTSEKDGPIKKLTLDYIVGANNLVSSIRLVELDFKQPTHWFDVIVKTSPISDVLIGDKNTRILKLACESESGNLISKVEAVKFISEQH